MSMSDRLRAGRSGYRIPVGARFSAPVQTGHSASCKMGTGSFPGVRCGRGVTLTTHPLLVPRSKIEYSHTSTLPKGLRGLFFFYWRYNPLWVCILQPSSGAIASSRTRLLDHTQRRATVSRTPLDEWSVRRRDLYLKIHNTRNRQTSMPLVGFEPTIAAGERP